MIEKTDYKQWDNSLLLTQLKQDLYCLPGQSQAFYWDILKTPELDTNTLFLRELFALINYELVWLELEPILVSHISSEELRRLIPWVSEVNQKRWDKMITTYHAYYVFDTLKVHAEGLLKDRKEQVYAQFVDKIETGALGEKLIPTVVKMHRKTVNASNFLIKILKELTWLVNFDTYSQGNFNENEYLQKSIDILKNMPGSLAYQFYEDLNPTRNIPDFKQRLIRLLNMEYRMGLINASIEPTYEELDEFIALLEEESKKTYENKKAKLSPQVLHQALKRHLKQAREALITPLIIFQNDEKDLVLEFPKASWCEAFVSHLAGPDKFTPMYYQGQSHSLCFPIQKVDDEIGLVEFSSESVCNRLRRLVIDYPEKSIASVPTNNKAICISNKKDVFFKHPLPSVIMSTSVAEKADTERALHLLQLGFKDDKSFFVNLPKELISIIAVLISYAAKSEPLSGAYAYNFNRI